MALAHTDTALKGVEQKTVSRLTSPCLQGVLQQDQVGQSPETPGHHCQFAALIDRAQCTPFCDHSVDRAPVLQAFPPLVKGFVSAARAREPKRAAYTAVGAGQCNLEPVHINGVLESRLEYR